MPLFSAVQASGVRSQSSPGSSRPEGEQRARNSREYRDLGHPHSLCMLLSCTALGPGRPRATCTFASADTKPESASQNPFCASSGGLSWASIDCEMAGERLGETPTSLPCPYIHNREWRVPGVPYSTGQAMNQGLVPRLGTWQAQRAVFIVAQAVGLGYDDRAPLGQICV